MQNEFAHKNAPLSLIKAGDTLKFDAAFGTRMSMAGSAIKTQSMPPPYAIVSHVRNVEFDQLPGKMRRAYFSGVNEGNFLQIYYSDDAELAPTILWCKKVLSLPLTTEEEIDIFCGTKGEGNGSRSYSLNQSHFLSMGYTAEEYLSLINKIRSFSDNVDAIRYLRDIGSSESRFITPLKCRETEINEKNQSRRTIADMWFMLYKRDLLYQLSEFLMLYVEKRDDAYFAEHVICFEISQSHIRM